MNISLTCPLVVRKGLEASDEDSAVAYSRTVGSSIALQVGAVFDGCGGTGSERLEAFDSRKSAWIGSRLAAHCFYEYVGQLSLPLDYKNVGQAYHDQMAQKLREASQAWQTRSAITIKSRMVQEFPTTMAANLLVEERGQILCTSLWAGDSRCYVVMTDRGLMQLSVDDISNHQYDAYENLISDGIMNNVIHNGNFRINMQLTVNDRPCMFLTATDGCYAYFISPMHFELVLLGTLMKSATPEEWKRRLIGDLSKVAGDDFAMTISLCGFESFEDVKKAYRVRLEYLYKTYIAPYEAQEQWEAAWAQYKQNYNYYVEIIRKDREGLQQH